MDGNVFSSFGAALVHFLHRLLRIAPLMLWGSRLSADSTLEVLGPVLGVPGKSFVAS